MQSNLNRNFFIVSTFALANLKMLQDLQVLFEASLRKSASPQQSLKVNFHFAFLDEPSGLRPSAVCSIFDMLIHCDNSRTHIRVPLLII